MNGKRDMDLRLLLVEISKSLKTILGLDRVPSEDAIKEIARDVVETSEFPDHNEDDVQMAVRRYLIEKAGI
jgi:hypothetical protein